MTDQPTYTLEQVKSLLELITGISSNDPNTSIKELRTILQMGAEVQEDRIQRFTNQFQAELARMGDRIGALVKELDQTKNEVKAGFTADRQACGDVAYLQKKRIDAVEEKLATIDDGVSVLVKTLGERLNALESKLAEILLAISERVTFLTFAEHRREVWEEIRSIKGRLDTSVGDKAWEAEIERLESKVNDWITTDSDAYTFLSQRVRETDERFVTLKADETATHADIGEAIGKLQARADAAKEAVTRIVTSIEYLSSDEIRKQISDVQNQLKNLRSGLYNASRYQ